jgi:hypothetical protein
MRSRLAVRTTLDWGPDSNWSLTGPWHAKGRRGLLAADPPFAALGFTKGGFSSLDIDPDSNRTLLAWVETFASRAETPVTFEGVHHMTDETVRQKLRYPRISSSISKFLSCIAEKRRKVSSKCLFSSGSSS